eukprot:CAMPEP_0119287012 /NCGR_PEP_ID=MMETSP1329-20130426/34857_1 /TAXON_ID=114041 /ORGANISM="Genus nov. species nov., Strain RCC1024" /LENGTH=259 /DNA_ID=CAMNT_0007287763 /DNA_START=194 /DNA_END=969 /DNA_ORIENTATION=+
MAKQTDLLAFEKRLQQLEQPAPPEAPRPDYGERARRLASLMDVDTGELPEDPDDYDPYAVPVSKPLGRLNVEADGPVGVVGRTASGLPLDASTLQVLNMLLPGPPSDAARRAQWPEPLASDPAPRAYLEGPILVLGFPREAELKVWCHKMGQEVFRNEGCGLLLTRNVEWELPSLPKNLRKLFTMVLAGEAIGVGGRLALAPGVADATHGEMGTEDFHEARRGLEPLSAWLARTCARLAGEVRYATADPAPPPPPPDPL